MNSLEIFREEKLPTRKCLALQKMEKLVMMVDAFISLEDYLTCEKIWDKFDMKIWVIITIIT